MDKLFLIDEQRNWILGMESTLGEDGVKTTEMTTKVSEYSINLGNEAAVGLEKTDPNLERSYTVGKRLYYTASHATNKCFMKRRLNQCSNLHCCLILRNCYSLPHLQQPPP